MEKTYAISLMVCLFLLGGLLSFILLPQNVEVVKEVEVPVEVLIPTVCEEPVEVICDTPEPELSILELAVAAFLVEVEDDDDFLTVNNHEYDFDEVSVSKVYDKYTVEYNDDETTVDFKIKLKYDEDGERSDKQTFQVRVIFEEDEDPLVEV